MRGDAFTGHLNDPVLRHVRKDFPVLRATMTVEDALRHIREKGVGEKIVYFYVVNEEERLMGVLPTRRLLTHPLDRRVQDIMLAKVIMIPQTATLLDACELFVLYKFLAFPVVDAEHRVVGLIDITAFTSEVIEMTEQEDFDDLFQAIGFHIAQVRNASPLRAFRYRFPWLLSTLASGTLCAFLAGAFETTLAQALVVAFFLPLVLGLSESLAMQTMTLTLSGLHSQRPSLGWVFRALRQEIATGALLGAAAGLIAGVIVTGWRGWGWAPAVIGGAILLSGLVACVLGSTIPAVLRAAKLDPKIAAGPLTLALTDLTTLLLYFTLAMLVFRPIRPV